MKTIYYKEKPITDFTKTALIKLGISNESDELGVSDVDRIIADHLQYQKDDIQEQLDTLKSVKYKKLYEDIEVSGNVYQADITSQLNISNTIADYESLATDSDITDMFSDSKIEWTLADNTNVQLTLDELKAIRLAINKRRALIHIKYNKDKAVLKAKMEALK